MCMAIVFCVVTLLTLLQLSSKGFRKTIKAIYFYLETIICFCQKNGGLLDGNTR